MWGELAICVGCEVAGLGANGMPKRQGVPAAAATDHKRNVSTNP